MHKTTKAEQKTTATKYYAAITLSSVADTSASITISFNHIQLLFAKRWIYCYPGKRNANTFTKQYQSWMQHLHSNDEWYGGCEGKEGIQKEIGIRFDLFDCRGDKHPPIRRKIQKQIFACQFSISSNRIVNQPKLDLFVSVRLKLYNPEIRRRWKREKQET